MRAPLLVSALLTFHALATGCATQDEPDVDDVEDGGKADGVTRPVGTFETNNGGASTFNRVVLLSDKTFNVLAEGGGDIGGVYKFSSNAGGTKRYIRFLDPDSGELIARCEYKFHGNELELLPAAVSGDTITCEAETLTRVTEHAWCESEGDCALQGLTTPACAGAWTCDSGCSFTCTPTDACAVLDQQFTPCLGDHAEGCFDIYDAEIQACCYDGASQSQLCQDIRDHLGN